MKENKEVVMIILAFLPHPHKKSKEKFRVYTGPCWSENISSDLKWRWTEYEYEWISLSLQTSIAKSSNGGTKDIREGV